MHISHTGYRPEVISQIRPPQTNFVRIYPLDGRFKLNGCKSLSFVGVRARLWKLSWPAVPQQEYSILIKRFFDHVFKLI